MGDRAHEDTSLALGVRIRGRTVLADSLKLTARGLALMEELYPRFNAAEAQVVARIDAAGLPELTGYLRTMVATVEDMDAEDMEPDEPRD